MESKKEFKQDVEEILMQLLSENCTAINIMYRLCNTAITFYRRGQADEAELVWRYACALHARGKGQFRADLEAGKVWKND